MKKPFSVTSGKSSSAKLSSSSSSLRKLSGFGSGGVPPSKKSKMSAVSSSGMSHKDVTLAEAGKYGSLSEYAFFDKVCFLWLVRSECTQVSIVLFLNLHIKY